MLGEQRMRMRRVEQMQSAKKIQTNKLNVIDDKAKSMFDWAISEVDVLQRSFREFSSFESDFLPWV